MVLDFFLLNEIRDSAWPRKKKFQRLMLLAEFQLSKPRHNFCSLKSFMLLTCAGICIIVFNCLLGRSTIVFLSSFHLIHINVSLIPADRGWKERIRASDQ